MNLIPSCGSNSGCERLNKMIKESMVETEVTYTLEQDGKFVLIEQVPARVCSETGEQFFSRKTVEQIHNIINKRTAPKKTIETPVYEFV